MEGRKKFKSVNGRNLERVDASVLFVGKNARPFTIDLAAHALPVPRLGL